MKLPWIIAIATAGIATYVVSKNSNVQYAGTGAGANAAADQAEAWGTKQRVKGTGGSLFGQAKQGLGKVTGDRQMQGKGMLDEAVGNIKDAAGKAANAVSDTLRDASKS
ncbi:MAG: CsbD family protein [Janthinobacterium lividum]